MGSSPFEVFFGIFYILIIITDIYRKFYNFLKNCGMIEADFGDWANLAFG